MNRTARTAALAVALALVVAPALTGCFGGNPIDKIIEGTTGGGVKVGSLPEGFPDAVPVVDGDILLGLAVGDEKTKVYNVTVKTSGDPTQAVKDGLLGAGFTEQTSASTTSNEGTGYMFTSDAWGVLVVIGQVDGAWNANYTVTQTTS